LRGQQQARTQGRPRLVTGGRKVNQRAVEKIPARRFAGVWWR